MLADEDAEALALDLEEDTLLRLRALQLDLDLHRRKDILEELACALFLLCERDARLGSHLRRFGFFSEARLQLRHIGRRVRVHRLSRRSSIDIADADARIPAADQAEEAARRLLEHCVLQARSGTAEVRGSRFKRCLDRPAGPFHGFCHIRQPPFSCRRCGTSTTAAQSGRCSS